MPSLNVTFQRTPRALIVGDQTITIELDRAPSQTDEDILREGDLAVKTAIPPEASAVRQPETAGRSMSARPGSTASVLENPGDKVVTPLAQSNAVPVLSSLSGATHDIVTPEEMGLGGPSEEELADLRQLLTNAADQAAELRQMQRQSLDELQEAAVELAASAASFLVGYAIDNSVFAIDELIKKALHVMDADQPVRVRLNPADHELLKSLLKDPETARILKDVSCVDDDSINRGGCRIESGRRILVTDMHSRMEDIRRAWLEKLDDSQIERRGDGSASRTLRRFPDRRETA